MLHWQDFLPYDRAYEMPFMTLGKWPDACATADGDVHPVVHIDYRREVQIDIQ